MMGRELNGNGLDLPWSEWQTKMTENLRR